MTLERTYHVAVLMGGWANERPVSLMSGEGVAKALESRGHEVILLEADKNFLPRLLETKPDIVFNIAEGLQGESREAQVPALPHPSLPVPHAGPR